MYTYIEAYADHKKNSLETTNVEGKKDMKFENPAFSQAIETLIEHYGLMAICQQLQIWPHTVARWRNGQSIPRSLIYREILSKLEREMTAPPVPAVAVSTAPTVPAAGVSPGAAAPPGSPGAPGVPTSIDSLILQGEVELFRLRKAEDEAARAEGPSPKLTVLIEHLKLRLTKLYELQKMELMDREIEKELEADPENQ